MSETLLGAAVIGRALAPLVKDIYSSAKGELKKSFDLWSANDFPKKLAKRVVGIDKVRTIWSPEKNVSLRGFYYPNKIKSKDGKCIDLTDISILGDGCHVVQGIVGQGKSIAMRFLALQEVVQSSEKRLPVFLELRKITKTSPLMPSIYKVLSEYDVKMDDVTFSHLASNGRIVLLLDGFDEIESSLVRETTLDLEHLANKYPELKIIVSSRPNNEIQKLSSFQIREIAPLTQADYVPFLSALGLKSAKISEIVHAIDSSPSNVSGLIITPLMLTLVVFVYQSEKQIPKDLPEFFDKLFYTVFTRHDKLKAAFEREHHSGLSERKLQSLFEAFCFMVMQFGVSRTIDRKRFSEAFDLAQEYTEGSKCSEASFRKDITKVACLMLEEGVGDATFLHKSIAEYHAAAFIRSSDDVFAERFYQEAGKDWRSWRECLGFLKSIDPYRFSKYFEIYNVKEAIAVFEKLSVCKTGRQLAKALPSWINAPVVGYRMDEGDGTKYHISTIGSWRFADNIYSSELGDLLVRSAFRTSPEYLTKTEIEALILEGMHIEMESDREISIPLTSILDRYGFEEYSNAVGAHLEMLRSRMAEAEKLADKLKMRALIFDRKRRE